MLLLYEGIYEVKSLLKVFVIFMVEDKRKTLKVDVLYDTLRMPENNIFLFEKFTWLVYE